MPFPILPSNSASGYFLTKSLRFRSSASAYLTRTPASTTNQQKWTISAWVKISLDNQAATYQRFFSCGTTAGRNGFTFIYISDTCQFGLLNDLVSPNTVYASSQVIRDPSNWYHIVCAVDTTLATAADRLKVYINGVQANMQNGYAGWGSYTPITQNYNTPVNSTVQHTYGSRGSPYNDSYYDGLMDEINFVDGQQLAATSFGSFNSLTGVWQPAKYTGSYGTNGYYLPFTNVTSTTTLGYDSSGNSNNWTPTNFSLTAGSTYDSMNDVPTLTSATAANYCTLNFLDNRASPTLTDGNLTFTTGSATGGLTVGTMGASSGKWYVEFTPTSSVANECFFGIENIAFPLTASDGYVLGGTATSYAYRNSGQKVNNGSSTSYGASFTTNDVIGIALDLDAGTLTFYKNNTSQGTAFTGITGTYRFGANDGTGSGSISGVVNFGQRPFTYTPPTGFVALNTYNLPTSTIVKGNTVMDATLYTGNSGTQSVVNAAPFKPDFVWLKARSNALNHNLFDSVRGVQTVLATNSTGADNYAGTGELTAFNSNGFTLVNSGTYQTNQSGYTYVAWQWQAGQGTNTTNTAGSITSTVSANTTAGFSVATFTGTGSNATVGHGLGIAPSMIAIKKRSSTGNWIVYHITRGASYYCAFNLTGNYGPNSTIYNDTAPTSSVFTIGTDSDVNASGSTYVAYCWAAIPGYSSFGGYTGSNNTGASSPDANGPFIYTGFRPKFVLIKRTSAAADWQIFDSVRGSYNANRPWLQPNTSAAEGSAEAVDFLSNGFKIRAESGALMYPDGATFIYAAFAENPFKNALAR
jgi:hypothetical protein